MPRQGSQPGLPQYLNYSRLIAPGVIENKDGALLTSFEYAGPDQEYEDYDRMKYLAEQLNLDLIKLSNGWMCESNSLRVPISLTPTVNHCPDPTSALIAEERGRTYAAAGAHCETRHVLTLTYMPPGAIRRQFSEYFFGESRKTEKQSRSELLRKFIADTEEITAALRRSLAMWRLTDNELIHFLRLCVTGEDRPVGYPEDGGQLDYVIGSASVAPHGGQVGRFHTRVVGVVGFPEAGTSPQMCAGVLNFPFALRMSHRFIFLSTQAAVKDLGRKKNDFMQLNAYNPKRIIWGVVRNISKADPNDEDVVSFNEDADRQKKSVARAITELQEGRVRGGYYTCTVVVQDEDPEQAQAHALEVVAHLNQLGFSAQIETDHAADAWGGSWPGHGTRNVRKPMLTTRHFANLWPTSQTWRGEKTHPCPYYPPQSGPLMITTSTGNTPFFFNTHVKDVGNFLLIGPTGHGKTYALCAMAIAHLQFLNAQVHFYDRDAGAVVPTLACGGEFFDLDARQYAPLAHVDEEAERDWGLRLCEKLVALRNFMMTPIARADIQRALLALSTAPIEYRTITGLIAQIQTHEAGLKEALSFYAPDTGNGILDGAYTPTQEKHWLSYDMERLLGRGPEVSTPVLMAQIHEMGRRMDGRPSLALFDEGWMSAQDELLREYIEESSATNRKKNCSLGLVLHSPGNLATFPRRDLLLTNISTIIFLPNDKAMTEGPNGLRQHYEALGLGVREIKMLAEEMRPKQEYYAVQGKNRRRFQFDSRAIERAVLGVNGRDHKARVLALRETFGEEWVSVWLSEQGHQGLVDQWRQWGQKKEAA